MDDLGLVFSPKFGGFMGGAPPRLWGGSNCYPKFGLKQNWLHPPEFGNCRRSGPNSGGLHPLNCRQLAKQFADAGENATNGKYYIDPDGAGPGVGFEVYCDMRTDGGGWILVASNYFNDGLMTRGLERSDLFINSGLGPASPRADYLIGADLAQLEFSEARIWADINDDDLQVVDIKWPQSCAQCPAAEGAGLVKELSNSTEIDLSLLDRCHVDAQYLADGLDPEVELWITDPSSISVGGLAKESMA